MRILFLNKRPLFPADTGGAIRTGNVLRHLAKLHEVTYLCNAKAGEEEGVRQTAELGMDVRSVPWVETAQRGAKFAAELVANLFSSLPYNVAKDRDAGLIAEARRLLAEARENGKPFDLVVCDFVQMAENVRLLGDVPKLLFQHNVEAEVLARRAERESSLRRTYMRYQASKMRRYEAAVLRNFDVVVAVSPRDAEQFRDACPNVDVRVIDTAVDTAFFQSMPSLGGPPTATFVGSLDWAPNIDGVRWMCQAIWPAVRSAMPDARLRLVGRRPDESLRSFDGRDGVELVGEVPDVRPEYALADAVVVPLLAGGGTRIKVYEAMACGRAQVSTTLGAEGLSYEAGRHLLIAEEAESFAAAVVRLLSDASLRSDIGVAAREHVVASFRAEVVASQFESACAAAVDRVEETVAA